MAKADRARHVPQDLPKIILALVLGGHAAEERPLRLALPLAPQLLVHRLQRRQKRVSGKEAKLKNKTE